MRKIHYRLAEDMIENNLVDYYPYLTRKCVIIVKKSDGYYLATKGELKNDVLITHFNREIIT